MMTTVCESDGNWLSYHRIASKIFSMLKLLLQVIANHSNLQSKTVANKIYATSVRDLKPLADVASKWQFVLVTCSLQGVASSYWGILQLVLHHAAYHVLAMTICYKWIKFRTYEVSYETL